MAAIENALERPEEEDFGFSEPALYPSAGEFKINNKRSARRKITPPPWSMVVHIPAAKETLSSYHENATNISLNPFKRELFRSLIDGESNSVRSKKKHHRNVSEKIPSSSSSYRAVQQDSLPSSHGMRKETGNFNDDRDKAIPVGILKRKDRRMAKRNNSVASSTIHEEVHAFKESTPIKKKSFKARRFQKFMDAKDQILTSCNKNSEQHRYLGGLPMPTFLRNSFPSIYGVCRSLDLNLDQPNLSCWQSHLNLEQSSSFLEENPNFCSKIKVKPIENRHASLTSLLDKHYRDSIFSENDSYPRYFNFGLENRSEGLIYNCNNGSCNFDDEECLNGYDKENAEWTKLSEDREPEWANYNHELNDDNEFTNQSEQNINGEWIDNTQGVINDDWNDISSEHNIFQETSAPKSVYFDLEDRNDELHSDAEENTKFSAERLLSICDSGIDVDEDFRSMSRNSLQILSDDENEEVAFNNFSEETNSMPIVEDEPRDGEKWQDPDVLCGNRVSQMTQTYHDIEAVTRLLQEKEKDLELAARIGQQLLARNKALEEKNSGLESDLCHYSEKITQLKHDLQMKADLLHVYTNDFDDSSADTTPTGIRHINIDILQARVKNLEHENVSLRQEASQLACDTLDCEDKETELVHDVIKQLNEANLQVHQLSEELSKKIEDSLRQQEEATQLLAQLVELQASNKKLNRENEELASLVTVARECQEELTTELADLKEKYAEVLDLLHDTQEQLRRIQKKNYPSNRGAHLAGLFSSTLSSHDSIASELHGLNSSIEEQEKADGAKSLSRVFDTVRLTSKLGSSMPALGYSGGSVYSTPTKQANLSHLNTPLHVSGGRHSPYFGSMTSSHMSMASSGLPSLDSGADSDGSFHTDSEENYPASCNGVPGWPGTPDLDSCIRRLGPNVASPYFPYGCRTPDSIMSTGSGKTGLSGYSGGEWRLPQKLQIVKPIEGSLTLHQWSRLATPHLGGLLEEREGVAIKGAMNADLNLELYSMSDYEEDEDDKDNPGKQFMQTSGIYTFTNSTVLHPDDVTSLTPSLRPTQSSVIQTSLASRTGISCGSQPSSQPASRRGSTATFSTNVGLAKHLQERGVVRQTLEGIIPTATPANSPEGSRPVSPEPQESYKLPTFEEFARSIHAGASYLKRTLYGREPSVPGSPTPGGPKVNIVERVHALGVDRFVRYGGAPLAVGGVVVTRAQPTSPLLHLSNLIRSSAATQKDGVTCATTSTIDTTAVAPGGIMSTPRITSPGERRPRLPLGAPMGIPGQPGSGQLDSRLTQLKPGQRADLGTVGHVGGRPRPSGLGSVPGRGDTKMGTVGWTSLGRKGGLL